VILKNGDRITPAEIGVMASVGAHKLQVKALPRVSTISTGNITLQVALSKLGIAATALHLKDDKLAIKQGLEKALQANDVLLLSGGVSKGKYDFIP